MAFALTALYLIFTLLSPGALPDWLAAIHVAEVVGGLTLISLIPLLQGSDILELVDYRVLGLFAIVATMSTFVNKGGSIAIGMILNLLPILVVFMFIQLSVDSLARFKILTTILLFVAFFIFGSGLLAHFLGHSESQYLMEQHTADGVIVRFRGLGVLSDPNDVAHFYITLIPLLGLRWKKGATASNFFLSVAPAIILLIAVFESHSRGAVIALGLMLLFAFKDKLGPVKAGLLVGLAIAGLLALNIAGGRGMTDDDGGRVAAWMTALSVFKTHPLLGVGINNFGEFNDTGLTAHNSYLLCMAELGILGYLLWLGMIVSSWLRLTRIRFYGLTAKVKDATMTRLPSPLRGRAALATSAPRPEVPQVRRAPWMPPVPATAGAAAFTSQSTPETSVPRRANMHAPASVRFSTESPTLKSDEEYSAAAHAIRTALVGTLAASFFLSRTYSVTLYIVFGMAAALWSIRRKQHPEEHIPFALIRNRTLQIAIISIILVIIGVRTVGIR